MFGCKLDTTIIDPPLIIFYTYLIVIDQSIYNHDRAIIISVEFPAAQLKKGKITENWNLKNLENQIFQYGQTYN